MYNQIIRLTKAILMVFIIIYVSHIEIIKANPMLNQFDHYHYNINGSLNDAMRDDSHISFYARPPNKDYEAHVEIAHTTNTLKRLTPDAYNSVRDMLFRYEESKALGADINLSKKEQQANEIIMAFKVAEYNKGLVTPHLFNPSNHFFSVLEEISASPLFQILEKMPKGAVLHSHDTALCSTDFLIELTYRANLWVCQSSNGMESVALRFAKTRPTEQFETACSWQLLSEVRQKRGSAFVDKYLRERFTLYPTEKFLDTNVAWQAFMNIFGILDGLLRYAPVWSDYYYNALKEYYADGVLYLELRTTLPTLYDMDGTKYEPIDTVRIYVETLEKFKKDNPDFIGSRMIYAPPRNVDDKIVEEYVRICIEIESKYPDFVAGFDLVGQEDLGRPLKELIPQILTMPEHIQFFFHAAETNWYGTTVDENLIDAVLLGTKRIGHGFGLIKHPLVLEMVKARNIAIEVNPISNQVLQYVADYRNHPCAHLFADNYPIVISSDDPSFWKAKPLSHDFYIAFLGIASAHSDLRLLKRLAINSIQYSSLNEVKKADALLKWHKHWENFIDMLTTEQHNNAARQSFTMYKID